MVPEGRDEVRQRIDFLYEQAENATGNYNATRAMSAAGRNRGVALSKRSGPRADADLDAVARQWFDGARAMRGPTVAAVLPADRLPETPVGPARSWNRANGGDRDAFSVALPELAPGSAGRASDRAVAELTSGPSAAPDGRPRAALEAAPSGTPGGRPELPAARPAELAVAGPAGLAVARPAELPPTQDELSAPTPIEASGWGTAEPARPGAPETSVPGPAGTAVLPVATLPVPQTAPAPVPREPSAPGPASRRPSPAESKAGHRRKLTAARDLLARHAARLTVPAAMPQALTAEWEQPGWTAPGTTATTGAPAPAAIHDLADPLGGTGSFTHPLGHTGTNTGAFPGFAVTDTVGTGPFTHPLGHTGTDTGAFPGFAITDTDGTGSLMHPLGDTGTGAFPGFAITDTVGTGPFTHPLGHTGTDTGAFPGFAVTDTGSFAPVPAPFTLDTRADRAIAFARAQIGKPCVWGATGPDSYDCSSLTRAAWQAAGVTLPRAAHEQALSGTPVTLAALEPGDLVLFFDDDRHVGLHTGDGMMIHAPGPGSTIREESVYGAGESAIHRVIRPA
ncbi:C40 family peptidase [Streptomyces sp. NPDC003236]